MRFPQEQMGQSLSHGHLFAGGVQGVPGTGGGLGGQGQGLKHSHWDACLSNTAQASTWQFWELLVSDRFCLKKNNPNLPWCNRQRDGGQEESSIMGRRSQEAADGASEGWTEGGVVLPGGDVQPQVS